MKLSDILRKVIEKFSSKKTLPALDNNDLERANKQDGFTARLKAISNKEYSKEENQKIEDEILNHLNIPLNYLKNQAVKKVLMQDIKYIVSEYLDSKADVQNPDNRLNNKVIDEIRAHIKKELIKIKKDGTFTLEYTNNKKTMYVKKAYEQDTKLDRYSVETYKNEYMGNRRNSPEDLVYNVRSTRTKSIFDNRSIELQKIMCIELYNTVDGRVPKQITDWNKKPNAIISDNYYDNRHTDAKLVEATRIDVKRNKGTYVDYLYTVAKYVGDRPKPGSVPISKNIVLGLNLLDYDVDEKTLDLFSADKKELYENLKNKKVQNKDIENKDR